MSVRTPSGTRAATGPTRTTAPIVTVTHAARGTVVMRRNLLLALLATLAAACAPDGEPTEVVTEVVTETDAERVEELEAEVAELSDERDRAEADLERLRENMDARSRPEPSPSPAEREPNPSFGDDWTYENGVTVTLSQPADYTPSDSSFDPSNAPAHVTFEVTVTNDGEEDYDPVLLSLSAQSGSTPAEQIFDSAQGVGGSPSTTLLPGRSVTFPVAFGVQDPTDLVVEVSPGFEYQSVVFTGGVTAAEEPTEEATVSAAAALDDESAPVEEEPYDAQCADGTWRPDPGDCPAPPQGLGDGEGGVPGGIDTAPGYVEGEDYVDSYPDGPDDGTGVICTADGSYQVSPEDCP